jgi:hypothetical protein
MLFFFKCNQVFLPVFSPVIHLKSVRRLGIENEQSIAAENIHEEMGEEVAQGGLFADGGGKCLCG